MSELKRSTDFTAGRGPDRASQGATGIDQSQPWRTADMQQALERWDQSADAGFDPYNHVGARAKRPHAA